MVRSTVFAPLRIFEASIVLEIPPINTATQTRVPIAQYELEGHFAAINTPRTKLQAASKRSHPHPSRGLA